MWTYPEPFDVIIIGGGHAGCEAALASARMGASTLLLTLTVDTIAKMSCNPAIGGIGKGHMVREIDALGGEMGKVIDCTSIQYRMLNRTKGPAVWAPRAQADKWRYQQEMKHRLELCPNLKIKQGSVEELLVESDRIQGVLTKEGIKYLAKAVILSSGTFMRGLLHIGETNFSGGRSGDAAAIGISASLKEIGFELGRLKTGTPPRLHRRSIDFSLTEEQPGEEGVRFSYDECEKPKLPQISCHITYTTKETKEVILKNLHRSPMYSGKIQSIGPRYCPSIEDKIVRFADKERHQIFLEPEGLDTEEIYANGISSSLPFDAQLDFIRSIPSLRNAEIMRPAYAIEYDYVLSGQINATLETKKIEGLYLAGQVNGTTGYEEAAGQGLIAGINAAAKLAGKEPFILDRSEAYIGVMIDDLVTKGIDEPYRMFTSRAEHRLLLRQDNADLRLREYGGKYGLISSQKLSDLIGKKQLINDEIERLKRVYKTLPNGKGYSLSQIISRPDSLYTELVNEYPGLVIDHGEDVNFQIDLNLKYAGYIQRQEIEIERQSNLERIQFPKTFDFSKVVGLRFEAMEKLKKFLPQTCGQASRIPGISPADMSVLLVAITRKQRESA
ncbi:MAG: tRNA uridine-5-carboxymethylaminomethyl(34) synthesis enzyme MnmG [Waddliaceae bacterium]